MPKRNKPQANSPYKERFRELQVILIKKRETAVLLELAIDPGVKIWVPRSTLSAKSDREIESLPERSELNVEIAEWKIGELNI